MIALTGQSFCEGAYNAFYLVIRNLSSVAITHGCKNNRYFKVGEIF